MSKEVFKEIVGYEGEYQVSNLGRVKSLKFGRERILKSGKSGKGGNQYLMVILLKKGKPKTMKVARLVAIAFIKNPDSKAEVNHRNGDKIDNRVGNLEWCTRKENVTHAYDIGLSKNVGRNAPTSKLNEMQVRTIRRILEIGMLKQRRIAEIFKVDPSAISNINTRKSWSHI